MRTSIAQVAQRANVSTMTVSSVLRGRKNRYSQETYERVMAAVRELNYVPTRSFQNRHVETNTIGYVPYDIDVLHSTVDSLTLEGLCREARQHGYDLLIMLRDEADWMANREVVRFLDRRSDGFVMVSPRYGEWLEMLKQLVDQNMPVVVCYRRDVPAGVAWVDVDNEALMRQSVRHLLDHGHHRIALLSMSASDAAAPGIQPLPSRGGLFDGMERERYFKALMEEYGPSTCQGEIVFASGKDWIIYPGTVPFLRQHGFTAVICGDYVALQVKEQAEQTGLAVPRDLSILGIDNQRSAAEHGLSSMAFGYDEIGKLAVEAWIELKNGKDAADCCKVAPVKLISRQSVGKPPNP